MQIVISREEFLDAKGVGSPISDFMLDKIRIPHGLTERKWRELQRDADRARLEHARLRAAVEAEYEALLQTGRVCGPNSLQQRIEVAYGHLDNESTQAARRRLAKQGIDWQTAPRLAPLADRIEALFETSTL